MTTESIALARLRPLWEDGILTMECPRCAWLGSEGARIAVCDGSYEITWKGRGGRSWWDKLVGQPAAPPDWDTLTIMQTVRFQGHAGAYGCWVSMDIREGTVYFQP